MNMNIEPSKHLSKTIFYYFTNTIILELSWRELTSVSPMFFQEENNLFGFQNAETKSNILMELAKSAKDDALRELLVNRSTYRFVNIDIRNVTLSLYYTIYVCRHVTHKILQERNYEGQTLLAIIEVNR